MPLRSTDIAPGIGLLDTRQAKVAPRHRIAKGGPVPCWTFWSLCRAHHPYGIVQPASLVHVSDHGHYTGRSRQHGICPVHHRNAHHGEQERAAIAVRPTGMAAPSVLAMWETVKRENRREKNLLAQSGIQGGDARGYHNQMDGGTRESRKINIQCLRRASEKQISPKHWTVLGDCRNNNPWIFIALPAMETSSSASTQSLTKRSLTVAGLGSR